MNPPVIDTWRGEPGEFDLSGPDMGKWFTGQRPKAIMGWKGIKVWDDTLDPAALLAAYLDKAADESCGQCTPCRLGTAQMKTLFQGLCQGQGTQEDLARIRFLADMISRTARCDIGRTLAAPILDLMDAYAGTLEEVAKGEREVEPGEYTAVVTAPCISACPSHVNIPAYIEDIRMGRWSRAMDEVRQDCPMPGTIGRVCVRPCEAACRRKGLDEPLAIKGLKRFLADREMEGGLAFGDRPPQPRHPKKVAVIGAGPAGLSCAYYLGFLGYETMIFEAQEGPGGMAAYGIPAYRLPRDVIAHETALVEGVGATIQYNTRVGRDISLEDLKTRGFDAVFVGAGAPGASDMRCKGEDQGYKNFMPGVEFLARAARGEQPLTGKRAAVIGGGNVAMDCVRTARRLGFTEVNLIYRRTQAQMPADPLEIREAREEGVNFHELMAPVEILADESGQVTGLTCLGMALGEPDKSGRRRPVPIEGSEFTMAVDAVIPAIGQSCTVDEFLPKDLLSGWNTMVVDGATGQSKIPALFGGGDCATGPDILIRALAAGKNAARAIAGYLETGSCSPGPDHCLAALASAPSLFASDRPLPYPGVTRCQAPSVLDPELRVKNFHEVEASLSPAQARAESDRCLRCYRILLAAF